MLGVLAVLGLGTAMGAEREVELCIPGGAVSACPLGMSGRGVIEGFCRDAQESDVACVWPAAGGAPVRLRRSKDFDHYSYGVAASPAPPTQSSTALAPASARGGARQGSPALSPPAPPRGARK